MPIPLRPIALNTTSFDVALLHKVLAVLGLPVNNKEVAKHSAGQDTVKKVRALQQRLDTPIDESVLLDARGVAAITNALETTGFVTADRAFTVIGTVTQGGQPLKKRQRLIAFDLDLRGVAAYRTVDDLAAIQDTGGFEFLGETTSDDRGRYSFTFYDWQYRNAERLKADIVVYAVNDNQERERIIGRSRVVRAADYLETGLVRGLEVVIRAEERRTEYEILRTAMVPFLQESETSLTAISGSAEQLRFVADELEFPHFWLLVAGKAQQLVDKWKPEFHELLYGIGRQNIALTWPVLASKSELELGLAIARSIEQRIIRQFKRDEIREFLDALHEQATKQSLNGEDPTSKRLNKMLSFALPQEAQRAGFLSALRSFSGTDFSEFWTNLAQQPNFKDAIPRLLFIQQLQSLAGDNDALVEELQSHERFTSASQLLELKDEDWQTILQKTGVPEYVKGETVAERINKYATQVQNVLNASFPTQRIAMMVRDGDIKLGKESVQKGIDTFIAQTPNFNFASSRVHDFNAEIEAVAGKDATEVKSELMKLQRVYQVSPSPNTMSALMETGLNSAYSIANIPRESFIRGYKDKLGGETQAFAIHQRASHIAMRAEGMAMKFMDYTNQYAPSYAYGSGNKTNVVELLQGKVPNYSELFGSPDLCECEQCRSVYSAAAYFIDLLRFLWRGPANDAGLTPLQKLEARRPDLLHLPLTCENTNTIIPYIDLANEVMEYFAANGSLTNFEGYDTGETTADELRANPQNFNLEAYRKLKDAKYPFTLPYHQPLDVIRTYSDHLKVSRYQAMNVVSPVPNANTKTALGAESLRLCQEEYKILTGKQFDTTADNTPLNEFYGYTAMGQLEGLSAVREFLRRSGVHYTDLVELVKTQFINPFQNVLEFLQNIFSLATIDANTIYTRLGQIEAGALTTANDADISAALNAYNTEHSSNITPAQFDTWVGDHLAEFRQVVTLYQPESKCDLDTTVIRTIQSIYEDLPNSGVSNTVWSRFHRFIRLWRKLGWSIHETDLMLAALGETDITPATIEKLEAVYRLKTETKLDVNKLAVLWGNIDSYGKKSLYQKLFLNRAVQQIDDAFQADEWGNYLQANEVLADHQSAILAAFRMREDDLTAILQVAKVIDPNPRLLNFTGDLLNLPNLSTIYRYVLLAKALKMKIPDFCKLVTLFGASPFSTWHIPNQQFTDILPDATYKFYKLAASVKDAKFKAVVLEYIFTGVLPTDTNIGLDPEKTRQTAVAIREAFSTIEQDHPDKAPSPLTVEILTAKLGLTFQPDIVSKFVAILNGADPVETVTDLNLNVVIPDALKPKYSYVNGSGRLTSQGTMTDAERTTLQGLQNANANFQNAVQTLYAAPEQFIAENFDGIFTNLAEANQIFLDHPAAAAPPTLDEKLSYLYTKFVPLLKSKLRRDAITQHIAALIRLSEAATAVLIANDIENLISDLSTEGFSAEYFTDVNWTQSAQKLTDGTIDFDWGAGAPIAALPANNFSVRWNNYLAAPASGDYTLIVSVNEADEIFKLYLDDALILEKNGGNGSTSLEVDVPLNGAKLHALRLDYAEVSQVAGVRLEWKTATTALQTIPASVAYPAAIIDSFVAAASVYHRAAKFITGFGLSETELSHFVNHNADFANINFKALTAQHWQRVYDYTTLRDAVPQALALLTDVFTLANTTNPPPTVADLKALLTLATNWDSANLDHLVDTHFALAVADFKNEVALNRLRDVFQIIAGTGLSAQTIVDWGKAETNFDLLNATAQQIKNTVKAKYEEEDWLDLAGGLSDTLRENQREALIAYLLTLAPVQAWGAQDADGLFEYLLIDVQMGACMDTSRIVQANSSVQMFINRCLLNLESDRTTGQELGVSPGSIDAERWEWMKNYRVWEANRKVFLYPENWLEPEWRNDRSDFFKDLESYLVQNDITDASVEQAFRDYLNSLAEVAHLDVCGIHQENDEQGKLELLHVFGRTHTTPYKFFYRTWTKYMKWSAWQKVPLDIRCVEDGSHSGVHLLPLIWKKRFFLFWTEFILIQEDTGEKTKSPEQVSKDQMSTLQPKKHWEIHLAWSEHVDGKWTPKTLSKEFLTQGIGTVIPNESRLRLIHDIDSKNKLTIATHCEFDGGWIELGAFILNDISSPLATGVTGIVAESKWGYGLSFMKFTRNDKLHLLDDDYLKKSTNHYLLVSPLRQDYVPRLVDPFFFNDNVRTYFVRPVEISIPNFIVDVDKNKPFIPKDIDDYKYKDPYTIPIPHVGPDDYMPVGILPELNGEAPKFFHGAGRGPESLGTFSLPANLAENFSEGVGFEAPVSFTMESRSLGTSLIPTVLDGNFASQPFVFNADAKAGLARARERVEERAEAGGQNVMTTADMIASTPYITQAFGGATPGEAWVSLWRIDAGLEFHTFYHPFSQKYITRLNEGQLPRLMSSDTALHSDNGSTFENGYLPNFTNGLVQKGSDFPTRTYYKENVCFDVYGANSLYNWELFFHAPLYIATRLSKNGKYKEAMDWFHYIFDPTTDALPNAGESEESRYWKVLPFKTTPVEDLTEWFETLGPSTGVENPIIGEWRDNPFDPHLVASNRPLAYMKNVVLKYVENLIAWGDSLFRQDTMESVNEALQIYVLAGHILGPRPEFVPKRGEIKAESYKSLEDKWDDFSNALVQLENIFPYSSDVSVSGSSNGTNLLGVGADFYFCIPPNDKLLEWWDTVEDRLFKIRHCQNIDGIERHLALFAPPIDPAALISAVSQGLSLGSILADLSSPPPIYRFTYLIQKANEFCSEVKALGSELLSVLEKKDAEELGRLRATHESQMLELMTGIKERAIVEAKTNRENIVKGRETAALRLQHYIDLLGNDSVAVPASPTISATLTADSQLPADTNIPTIETDVNAALADSTESGVKVIQRELAQLNLTKQGSSDLFSAMIADQIAGFMGLIPQFDGEATPIGVGAGVGFGGRELSWFASSFAKGFSTSSQTNQIAAGQAGTMAGYIRREQEWTLQANMAARDIVQLDKQITAADIRIQVAEKDLENHLQQIENSKAVEAFLKDKFTNQELYQWMKEQLFAVYKQSYNLAYDMAKKAEKAYKYERGTEIASFIQYGYWDNSKQGLVAGAKLQLALRQLEKSFIDENRRELELTKTVSLALLDPLALIQLRATGKCFVSLPEEMFDLDYQGHYFRRLKSVSLSIPCIAGPYTTVSCSLRLLSNTFRINATMNSGGKYEHENDDGLPLDDDRFRSSIVPVTSIAVSNGQNDSGMFEFAFRDDRYLPFEGAGAISEWQLELAAEDSPRQFDYETISDVIMHVKYTARETGGLFKDGVVTYLNAYLTNSAQLIEMPLMKMFNMRSEFSTEWHRFLFPPNAGGDQVLNFRLDKERFPFFTQHLNMIVSKIEVFARCTFSGSYDLIVSGTNGDQEMVDSDSITMSPNPKYGNIHKATVEGSGDLDFEDFDPNGPMALKMKHSGPGGNFHDLATNPAEVEDIFIVVHYQLEEP